MAEWSQVRPPSLRFGFERAPHVLHPLSHLSILYCIAIVPENHPLVQNIQGLTLDGAVVLKSGFVILAVNGETYISFDVLEDRDFEDGLHPNTQGHQKLFTRVKDKLEEQNIL